MLIPLSIETDNNQLLAESSLPKSHYKMQPFSGTKTNQHAGNNQSSSGCRSWARLVVPNASQRPDDCLNLRMVLGTFPTLLVEGTVGIAPFNKKVCDIFVFFLNRRESIWIARCSSREDGIRLGRGHVLPSGMRKQVASSWLGNKPKVKHFLHILPAKT